MNRKQFHWKRSGAVGALVTTVALLGMTASPAAAAAGGGEGATEHLLFPVSGGPGNGPGGDRQACTSFRNFGITMEYPGTSADNTFAGETISATNRLSFEFSAGPLSTVWAEGPRGTYASGDVSNGVGCLTANAGATIDLGNVQSSGGTVLLTTPSGLTCTTTTGSTASQRRLELRRTVTITNVTCDPSSGPSVTGTVVSTSDIALTGSVGPEPVNGCAPHRAPSQTCVQGNGVISFVV